MAIKKSALYSKLWESCDELRGGMDASQYKDYVLILLFMKYVTDKYHNKKNSLIKIPKGGSFHDMVDLKGSKDIGDEINKIITKLAKANDLVGVITVADFNDEDKLGSGKEMVDRLTNLISIFENEELDFSNNYSRGDDLLGDAYEYLMRHFATEAGKSKGQFYTPAEVSRVMAKLIDIDKSTNQNETLYDPTCGSGSLLLKASAEAANGITIYGQEKDNATAALAKMNMILHGNEIADIRQGNTLSNPLFKDKYNNIKRFDFAVANPPFSYKAWKNGFDPRDDIRFENYNNPPAKNGDYAFLLHFISSLKNKGKGAIILPHGVLFRGNSEAKIREKLIKKGLIKGVIGLPANLFYGTGIPACIIIIDKENSKNRTKIFMIDASNGFIKDGNKNRLREQDIRKIIDVFNKQTEIPNYSRMISIKEIKDENNFNLNIPRYIETYKEEENQDIEAHLLGGIPNKDIDKLKKYWEIYPNMKKDFFSTSDRSGYSRLNIKIDDLKQKIFSHPEFINYTKEVEHMLSKWKNNHTKSLKKIDSSIVPQKIISKLSDDMLNVFSNKSLIDKYDIYQYLLSYWVEIMRDDIYLIIENGWLANEELIPKKIIINNYFEEEKLIINELKLEMENKASEKEDFEDKFTGEYGVLEDLKGSRGNVTKANVKDRLMELKRKIIPESNYLSDELKNKANMIKQAFNEVNWEKGIEDEGDIFLELDVIHEFLTLYNQESKINKEIEKHEQKLDKKVINKYKDLNIEEIKSLVVEDKWINSIVSEVKNELSRISNRLTIQIKKLAERYQNRLFELENNVGLAETKVKNHLKRMGFEW